MHLNGHGDPMQYRLRAPAGIARLRACLKPHIGLEFIMRTLHAIALTLAVATCLAPAAYASHQGTDTGSPAVQVPGSPGARYKLSAQDFDDYKGPYLLSNGKGMEVLNRSRRFYAEIDGEPRVELIPVGYNVFITRETDMMFMFNEYYNGRVNDVIIRPRRAQIG